MALTHGPLSTVHWNTCVPTGRLLICVVGLFTSTMVMPLGGDTIVQVPTAGKVTELAAMNTVFGATGTQMLWSGPAFATRLLGS